jgi:cell volume regulation protein A
MQPAHEFILLGGALGLLSLILGLTLSRRIGAPLLLVFLVLGMLAGEDGPGGIAYNDHASAYLIGSIALAVILFEGGIKTDRRTLRLAAAPALALATLGVVVTAGLVGAAAWWLAGASLERGAILQALLIGAIVAPTDAAAVTVMLRQAGLRLPERLVAVLEVESGLNDPMSVFLTTLLVEMMLAPADASLGHAALLFVEEMLGGAVFGLAGGAALLWLVRRLRPGPTITPTLAVAAALALFGGAQSLGASGFVAVYLAGVVMRTSDSAERLATEHFFEALAWLAQIALFVMLGLLVNPHELVLIPNLLLGLVLIVAGRPLASLVCLLPFRFSLRQTGFAAWVGLRGAVPIYLAIIPVLAGVPRAGAIFGSAFVMVVVSLVVQGWTVGPAARLLRVELPPER